MARKRSVDSERDNERIATLLSEGKSIGAIVRLTGCSVNTVRRVKRGAGDQLVSVETKVIDRGSIKSEPVIDRGSIKSEPVIDRGSIKSAEHVHRVGDTVEVNGVSRRIAKVLTDGWVEVTIGGLGRQRVVPDGCR